MGSCIKYRAGVLLGKTGWAGNSCGMGVDLVTVGKESLNRGGGGG